MEKTSKNGWIRFEANIKAAGDWREIVRSQYAKNLFAIMSKFNVLPTEKRFKDLTDFDLSFIIMSMNQEAKGIELAKKGLETTGDEFYDNEFDWEGDMQLVKDGDNPEDLNRQLEDMLSPGQREERQTRLENADAAAVFRNEGGLTQQEEAVNEHRAQQLDELHKLARESQGSTSTGSVKQVNKVTSAISKEDAKSIEDAIADFNDDDDGVAKL